MVCYSLPLALELLVAVVNYVVDGITIPPYHTPL